MKITIVKSHSTNLISTLKRIYPQMKRINAFADGNSGFRAIQSDIPDIAIVDMDVAGLVPLKEMNNTLGIAASKYLLLSEWETFAYEARQFGASGFLAKPFSEESLLREVERIVGMEGL